MEGRTRREPLGQYSRFKRNVPQLAPFNLREDDTMRRGGQGVRALECEQDRSIRNMGAVLKCMLSAACTLNKQALTRKHGKVADRDNEHFMHGRNTGCALFTRYQKGIKNVGGVPSPVLCAQANTSPAFVPIPRQYICTLEGLKPSSSMYGIGRSASVTLLLERCFGGYFLLHVPSPTVLLNQSWRRINQSEQMRCIKIHSQRAHAASILTAQRRRAKALKGFWTYSCPMSICFLCFPDDVIA